MALDRKRIAKPATKLRKLIRNIGNTPKPDEVHDLRTNTRRFEALFEALSLDTRGVAKSTLKDLGRIRKRAGKVRDMDVLTAFASTVHVDGEEECAVRLLEHLGVLRRKRAYKLRTETQRVLTSLQKDLKRTPAALDKIVGENGGASESQAAANATATAARLAVQLAFPPKLGPENLHRYRLKVKELRNVLRLADTSATDRRFVDDLGAVKNAIGEWHDWQELTSTAQKVLNHGKQCRLLGELNRVTRQKYDHGLGLARGLRKKYLHDARVVRKGASQASPGVPGQLVWEAISTLAG